MGLSLFESIHWATGGLIETVLLILALRRRVFRQLPFFTAYLGLLVTSEVARWLAFEFTGINSTISFGTYWTTQGILLLARAAVVYELCQVSLSLYAGIWRLCRPFLIALAVILVAGAEVSTGFSVHQLAATILTAERGLELTVVGILILGLAFCRYYRIGIQRHVAWIALGLGFYSAVQVANNSFLQDTVLANFPIWEMLRLVSFNIATVFWLVAVWKPLPALRPAPVLLARGEYDRLAPQMTVRLRELNTRLLEMWK